MTCLAVSGCAHCLACPVRLGRICIAYAESLVQIGLLSATAPLPLSGQKKNVYEPAGRNLLRMPGLAAAAQKEPRVLFAPSGLHPTKQLRRERSESSTGPAQLDETKPICSGRTKRRAKGGLLLYRARHVCPQGPLSCPSGNSPCLLPRQKKMWESGEAPPVAE